MPLLDVRNLRKDFGGLRANDDISFTLAEGELLGVIGPNGAGKTTLFNCIAGLHPLTAGQILFDGTDITACRPTPSRGAAWPAPFRCMRPPAT